MYGITRRYSTRVNPFVLRRGLPLRASGPRHAVTATWAKEWLPRRRSRLAEDGGEGPRRPGAPSAGIIWDLSLSGFCTSLVSAAPHATCTRGPVRGNRSVPLGVDKLSRLRLRRCHAVVSVGITRAHACTSNADAAPRRGGGVACGDEPHAGTFALEDIPERLVGRLERFGPVLGCSRA